MIGNDSEQHDALEDSDNEALATLQKDKASTYTSITNLPGTEGSLFSVVTSQSYPERLPSLPSTSLEDSFPDQDEGSRSSHQSGSLVSGRSNEEKTPVQSKLEESENLCSNLLLSVLYL